MDHSYISVISQLFIISPGVGARGRALRGPAAASMRSMCTSGVHAGVLMRAAAGNRPLGDPVCTLLVTLCRFDDNTGLKPKPGPFIPTQRRLAIMEYPGIQGRDLWAGF